MTDEIKAYAIGADGVKKDLRDVDYLSLLNGASTEDAPIITRAADRLIRPSVEFTSEQTEQDIYGAADKYKKFVSLDIPQEAYASRIAFSNQFMTSLTTRMDRSSKQLRWKAMRRLCNGKSHALKMRVKRACYEKKDFYDILNIVKGKKNEQ